MTDLNQCSFTGRLGADVEVKSTQRGDKVANFRLAVDMSWRSKETGEKREKTTWVPVVVWGDGLVRICESYLRKGSRVFIQGAFSVRDWEAQDGSKRYATEVVLQGFDAKLIMLDGPSGNGDRANRDTGGAGDRSERGGYGGSTRASAGAGGRHGAMMDDDPIPF